MSSSEFQDGFITYESGIRKPGDFGTIAAQEWDNGYLAFSNREIRWRERNGHPLIDLFEGKADGKIQDVKGYLMEVGLWRSENDRMFEEVCIEREDRGLFFQRWILITAGFKLEKPTDYCYYRKAQTMAGGWHSKKHRIFENKDLKSIEVVVPKTRLHFFITTGGK